MPTALEITQTVAVKEDRRGERLAVKLLELSLKGKALRARRPRLSPHPVGMGDRAAVGQ